MRPPQRPERSVPGARASRLVPALLVPPLHRRSECCRESAGDWSVREKQYGRVRPKSWLTHLRNGNRTYGARLLGKAHFGIDLPKQLLIDAVQAVGGMAMRANRAVDRRAAQCGGKITRRNHRFGLNRGWIIALMRNSHQIVPEAQYIYDLGRARKKGKNFHAGLHVVRISNRKCEISDAPVYLTARSRGRDVGTREGRWEPGRYPPARSPRAPHKFFPQCQRATRLAARHRPALILDAGLSSD